MPPPMMSSTRGPVGSCARAGFGTSEAAGAANASASAAAPRRMVRTSSSTERPLFAARSRSCFFSFSSSPRMVMLAMEFSSFPVH
jgi:hypothetical protein